MNTSLILTLAAAALALTGCSSAPPTPTDRVVEVAGKVGHAIERGASAAERGVRTGLSAAARGVEKGASATAEAAESVASKVRPSSP